MQLTQNKMLLNWILWGHWSFVCKEKNRFSFTILSDWRISQTTWRSGRPGPWWQDFFCLIIATSDKRQSGGFSWSKPVTQFGILIITWTSTVTHCISNNWWFKYKTISTTNLRTNFHFTCCTSPPTDSALTMENPFPPPSSRYSQYCGYDYPVLSSNLAALDVFPGSQQKLWQKIQQWKFLCISPDSKSKCGDWQFNHWAVDLTFL